MIVNQLFRRKNKLLVYMSRSKSTAAEQPFNGRLYETSKETMRAGEKYGPLLLTFTTFLGGVIGLSWYVSRQNAQLDEVKKNLIASDKLAIERKTTVDEKLVLIEQVMKERLIALEQVMNEKAIAAEKVANEKAITAEKVANEKVNAATHEATKVALENFLKYSYSSEYKDMRKPNTVT